MGHFQHALSSIRSIPWSRYYGEFNKVCNTKNARRAGLATLDLATKNPLGVIATAALVILAWEFKKRA
ncbi:MAG: hypothetical protein L7U87_04740 [Chlamydiales bacterium]|nr:hypothetical protein [Chlamydiales bacterium]